MCAELFIHRFNIERGERAVHPEHAYFEQLFAEARSNVCAERLGVAGTEHYFCPDFRWKDARHPEQAFFEDEDRAEKLSNQLAKKRRRKGIWTAALRELFLKAGSFAERQKPPQ